MTIPAAAIAAFNSEELADQLALLVTIRDASLVTPLRYTTAAKTRLSDDPLRYGIVSMGETYVAAIEHGLLPNDSEQDTQETTLAIDNVDEDRAPAIRGLSAVATVDLALVLVARPDEQFAEIPGLFVTSRGYDLLAISVDLSRHANGAGDSDLLEPLSGERQTASKAPGLARR